MPERFRLEVLPPAEDTREEFDQDAVSKALVTARFIGTAERHDAARAVDDRLQNGGGIGTLVAVAIDRPTVRKGQSLFIFDFDLATGHDGGGGIKKEGGGIGRHTDCDRVGADHRRLAVGGNHIFGGVVIEMPNRFSSIAILA